MATTAISVREYLSTVWRPDRDYVDGEVLERNLGEKLHSLIQGFLQAWFFSHREQWSIVALPEQRVQINADSFRVPDVTLVRADYNFERIVDQPPVLCVEILSRQDSLSNIRERVDDYAGMGVKDIWIIDPHSRRAYTCILGKFEDFTGDTLRIAGTEIHVRMADLWAELDR
jgi:Uma2 family endonuclease